MDTSEIHIMGYRASIIGGRLSIGPAEGGGTLVRCEVPLLDLEHPPWEGDALARPLVVSPH